MILKIYMYSDGCKKNASSSAATIMLTDTQFLGVVETRIRSNSSGKAELIGLCQGLQYLDRRLGIISNQQTTEIIARVDHESIVNIYNRLLTNPDTTGLAFSNIWDKIMLLVKGKNITIEHIKGHQIEYNPNKTCDIIASMLL